MSNKTRAGHTSLATSGSNYVVIEDKKALELTGFSACDFGADYCDNCGTAAELYYRRTSYWTDEGEYYCLDCVKMEAFDNQEYEAELKLQYEKEMSSNVTGQPRRK
ncbi:hypothetical protein EGM51_09805 [Verrucomicrobia bacterium S94]|nr:hypothetical protein EGM51_09805 [Verrucomicrobia bacterium S94]